MVKGSSMLQGKSLEADLGQEVSTGPICRPRTQCLGYLQVFGWYLLVEMNF